MIPADSVLSTPPTNTPVDTSRRHFLTAAAVGSIVGAGSLAAAAMAPSVPAAVTVPLAPATAEPTVHDPVFGLIEAHGKDSLVHLASLREQERLEKAGIWHCDAAEQACHAEFRIFNALLAAGASTLPGLVAKLAYLQDIAERDAWMLTDRPRRCNPFACRFCGIHRERLGGAIKKGGQRDRDQLSRKPVAPLTPPTADEFLALFNQLDPSEQPAICAMLRSLAEKQRG